MPDDPGGLVPRPDPTLLTAGAVTAAKDDLRRELAAIRELLETQIAAVTSELHQTWNLHKGDVHAERIEREALRDIITDKFHERDLRFAQMDESRRQALEMALRTARELVDTKAEANRQAGDKFQEAIVRQLETQARLNSESRDRLSDQIRALEDRLNRGEGVGTGAAAQRTEQRLNLSQIVAFVAALAAIAGALLLAFKH